MANQMVRTEPESQTLLSSLSTRYRTKARYSEDGQYEGEQIVSFDPAGLSETDLEHLRGEVDKALKPLSQAELIQEISLLRTVTRSRAEHGSDLKAMLLVYAQDLADVPGMALKRALLEIRQTSTWFPTIAEIREKAEAKCQKPRAIKAALTRPTPTSNIFAQVRKIGPRATPQFVAEQMVKFQTRMAALDAEVENGRKSVTLKPLHVFNPATAHFGKEPIEQSKENAA